MTRKFLNFWRSRYDVDFYSRYRSRYRLDYPNLLAGRKRFFAKTFYYRNRKLRTLRDFLFFTRFFLLRRREKILRKRKILFPTFKKSVIFFGLGRNYF